MAKAANTFLGAMALLGAASLVLSSFCLAPYSASAKAKVGSASRYTRLTKNGKKINLNCAQYKDAVAAFTAKKYNIALNKFQALDATGFSCDIVHYFIAQCYEHTGQMTPAMMNYQWVTENSTDSRLVDSANNSYEQLDYYNAHRTYGGQGSISHEMAQAPPRKAKSSDFVPGCHPHF